MIHIAIYSDSKNREEFLMKSLWQYFSNSFFLVLVSLTAECESSSNQSRSLHFADLKFCLKLRKEKMELLLVRISQGKAVLLLYMSAEYFSCYILLFLFLRQNQWLVMDFRSQHFQEYFLLSILTDLLRDLRPKR